MTKRLMMTALGVLALTLALAACGDDSDETTTDTGAAASGETVAGTFEPVADAPEGADGIEGTAEMAVGDDGTTAMIELTGLEPDTEYASHVHAGSCDQPDPGGPHFMFDLNGEEMPPNEIHLPFTSDADGNGSAEATNEAAVPDPATRSIVVHLASAPMDSEQGSKEDMDKDMDSEHGSDMDMEDMNSELGKDEDKDKKDSEHGKDDGHTGHTHQPKLVCADLS